MLFPIFRLFLLYYEYRITEGRIEDSGARDRKYRLQFRKHNFNIDKHPRTKQLLRIRQRCLHAYRPGGDSDSLHRCQTPYGGEYGFPRFGCDLCSSNRFRGLEKWLRAPIILRICRALIPPRTAIRATKPISVRKILFFTVSPSQVARYWIYLIKITVILS